MLDRADQEPRPEQNPDDQHHQPTGRHDDQFAAFGLKVLTQAFAGCVLHCYKFGMALLQRHDRRAVLGLHKHRHFCRFGDLEQSRLAGQILQRLAQRRNFGELLPVFFAEVTGFNGLLQLFNAAVARADFIFEGFGDTRVGGHHHRVGAGGIDIFQRRQLVGVLDLGDHAGIYRAIGLARLARLQSGKRNDERQRNDHDRHGRPQLGGQPHPVELHSNLL